MNAKKKMSLAKSVIDVGYFTEDLAKTLDFWRIEVGLDYEPPVKFNDGLTQYRHKLGDSIIKINTSKNLLNNNPGRYAKLVIAREGQTTPETVFDPDGNEIMFVPPGYNSVTGVGICIKTSRIELYKKFYQDDLECAAISDNTFQLGDSIIFLEKDPNASRARHWVDKGLRYFTIHVRQIDNTYAALMDAGVEPGEAPYSIGKIARISFIKDPDGRWVEVAQRVSLAGPWWLED